MFLQFRDGGSLFNACLMNSAPATSFLYSGLILRCIFSHARILSKDDSATERIDICGFDRLNIGCSIIERYYHMSLPLDDETRYRQLMLLESMPELSQRELASEMG